MLNQITKGDCFEIMPDIQEKSIDLIIFDPPYNIGSDAKITFIDGKPITTNLAWSNEGFNDEFDNKEYINIIEKSANAFLRVLADNGSIIVFFDRGYSEYLLPLKKAFKFRNTIDFIKKNPIPHMRMNNYRSGFESAMWLSRDKYHINFLSQEEMINVFYGLIGIKETEHPTEKYRWMIEPLIKRHTNEGNVILDPMCGSGTSCVVAKELGRKFIGIELNEDYYQMAYKRINNTAILPTDSVEKDFI